MNPKKKVNKTSSPQTTKAKSKSELTLKQQKDILLQEARRQNREWALARCSEEERSRMVSEALSSTKSNTESKGAYKQYNMKMPEGIPTLKEILGDDLGETTSPDLEDKAKKTS